MLVIVHVLYIKKRCYLFIFQEAWTAFHKNKELVRKFLAPLYVGPVETPVPKKQVKYCFSQQKSHLNDFQYILSNSMFLLSLQDDSLRKDFAKLRKIAEKMGLFKADLWFFYTYIGNF